jgi:hypothetical protein
LLDRQRAFIEAILGAMDAKALAVYSFLAVATAFLIAGFVWGHKLKPRRWPFVLLIIVCVTAAVVMLGIIAVQTALFIARQR